MTKKDIRPVITSAKVLESMTAEEKFQNQVLRPIIKLQHDLIIGLFCNFLKHSGFAIEKLEPAQKREFFKHSLSKNQALRNQYIGLITGLCTQEEFEVYLQDSSAYGRRILQMIAQRLYDTLS